MFFKKTKSLTVQDQVISIREVDGKDYVCLTDMVNKEEGSDRIKNWMRNRNTVAFLGLWESLNNPDFNNAGFDIFKEQAGLNSFTLTPKKWIEATNAIGIISKSGRGGGTYAHMDIALEFGSWMSPEFRLYFNKDYQRLKEIENNSYNLEWDVKRALSKTNYQLQTDAIKDYVIPSSKKWLKEWEYAEEADILNVVIFGCTAKEWKKANPEKHKAGGNLRDFASINELHVIMNAESRNADMIRDGLDKETRFAELQKLATWQLDALHKIDSVKSIKRMSDETYVEESKKESLSA